MELDRRGAELLFQVLTEREEKNSIAIASNESFSGWTKTFTDPRLCAAIEDRLTFNGAIIETGSDSYRLAATLARKESHQTAVLMPPRRNGVCPGLAAIGLGEKARIVSPLLGCVEFVAVSAAVDRSWGNGK